MSDGGNGHVPSWRAMAHWLWAVLLTVLSAFGAQLYGRLARVEMKHEDLNGRLIRIETKLDVLLRDRLNAEREMILDELARRGILERQP